MPAYSIMHHLKVLSSENPALNPPHFHLCVPNTQEWFKTSTRQAAAVSKQNRVLVFQNKIFGKCLAKSKQANIHTHTRVCNAVPLAQACPNQ